jgi:hypothetical protein
VTDWLPWPGYPSCPCGCGSVGLKLQLRHDGHLVGCVCRACIGRRNRKAGKASERRRHKRLGGVGWTPNDELMHSYSINVTTSDKTGRQVPKQFVSFIESEWLRKALLTAEKKIPVGSDAMPSVWLEPPRGGSWLLVKVPAKGLR